MKRSGASNIKYGHNVKLGKTDELDLNCENCGSKIHGSNININSSLAKCGDCDTVFKIKEDHFFTNERLGRPEMIMPSGTDVLELNESLDIRLDWLKSYPRGTLGFLTAFGLFWNVIIVFIAIGVWSSGDFSGLAFMSIHTLVGLGFAYYLASVYLNYTDIIVGKSYIEINHGPVKNPFIRSKKIESQDIDQLYVSKYVSSTTNGKPTYAYALYAILKTNGRKVRLVKEMNRETQLYLEQEIERFLKITDRPVSGAISN